MSVTNR